MTAYKESVAEFLGTMVLVLGGCGAAVFAAEFIGFLGVSIAFGLTVVAGAYAFGPVSGGHFNPAVTLGLVAGGRFPSSKAPMYIGSQVLGGIAGGLLIYIIASSQDGFSIGETAGTFATNGYGSFSPEGYELWGVFVAEAVLTAVFLIVILGATAKKATASMAGLTIGLTLTLIHLISIPISNTSVNPARSTSQALVAAIFGDSVSAPIEQLWLFWVAPIVGAIVGGIIYRSTLESA